MKTRLLSAVEPYLALLPPERRRMLVQFIKFGIIGVFGFMWFTGTVYALAPLVGPYIGGLGGFLVAASANWAANRFWTFRHATRTPAHRQWLMFLAANSLGSGINLAVNFTLIATVPFCHEHLVVPALFGTLAGMFFNFSASRNLVFR